VGALRDEGLAALLHVTVRNADVSRTVCEHHTGTIRRAVFGDLAGLRAEGWAGEVSGAHATLTLGRGAVDAGTGGVPVGAFSRRAGEGDLLGIGHAAGFAVRGLTSCKSERESADDECQGKFTQQVAHDSP